MCVHAHARFFALAHGPRRLNLSLPLWQVLPVLFYFYHFSLLSPPKSDCLGILNPYKEQMSHPTESSFLFTPRMRTVSWLASVPLSCSQYGLDGGSFIWACLNDAIRNISLETTLITMTRARWRGCVCLWVLGMEEKPDSPEYSKGIPNPSSPPGRLQPSKALLSAL